MKVYHICHGRPIGPSWHAYLEKPILLDDPFDQYGTWIEETELSDLLLRFANHLEYAKQHFPESYWPYELKVEVRRDPPPAGMQEQMNAEYEEYLRGLGDEP